jgi:uncharacterized BrkB/YihY/UPF0761 family membrane protein
MGPQKRRKAPSRWVHAIKARAEGSRRRAEELRRRLEARRGHNKSVDVAFTAFELDRETGGSLLAAALAYRLFLWALPACLVLVAGLGFASTASPDAPARVVRDLGIASIPAQSVNQAAQHSSGARWVALIVGAGLLYLATNALIRALWVAHALIWGSPRARIDRRPRLVGVFLAACLAIAAVTSLAAVIRDAAPTPGLVVMLADVGVYAAAWWLVTTQLPHGDASYAALIPGALVFGAGVQAMHLVTVYYLARRVTSASQLYGTLGGAAALLLGLYLIGRLVVVSAEFNQALRSRAGLRARPADAGGAVNPLRSGLVRNEPGAQTPGGNGHSPGSTDSGSHG